jgi:hypothetical protein
VDGDPDSSGLKLLLDEVWEEGLGVDEKGVGGFEKAGCSRLFEGSEEGEIVGGADQIS